MCSAGLRVEVDDRSVSARFRQTRRPDGGRASFSRSEVVNCELLRVELDSDDAEVAEVDRWFCLRAGRAPSSPARRASNADGCA